MDRLNLVRDFGRDEDSASGAGVCAQEDALVESDGHDGGLGGKYARELGCVGVKAFHLVYTSDSALWLPAVLPTRRNCCQSCFLESERLTQELLRPIDERSEQVNALSGINIPSYS